MIKSDIAKLHQKSDNFFLMISSFFCINNFPVGYFNQTVHPQKKSPDIFFSYLVLSQFVLTFEADINKVICKVSKTHEQKTLDFTEI